MRTDLVSRSSCRIRYARFSEQHIHRRDIDQSHLQLQRQKQFSNSKMAAMMTKSFVGAGLAKAAPRSSQVTRAVEFYGPDRYVYYSWVARVCNDIWNTLCFIEYRRSSCRVSLILLISDLHCSALWLGPLSGGSVPDYLNGEYPGGAQLFLLPSILNSDPMESSSGNILDVVDSGLKVFQSHF